MPHDEERRPAGNGAAAKQADEAATSLTDRRAVERSRRRWRLHLVGCRRRISVALDQRCGIELPAPDAVQIDYRAAGLDLGYPERRAAGLALVEREQAA